MQYGASLVFITQLMLKFMLQFNTLMQNTAVGEI